MDKAKLSAIIASFASIVVFVFVFNIFYGVLFNPPFTIYDISEHLPESYAKPDDMPDKLVVKTGRYQGMDVYEFWYHWNYDGAEQKDDWEPVVVFVDGDKIVAASARWHYNWRTIFTPPSNGTHVYITMLYRYHTPMFKTPEEGYERITLMPEFGQTPEDIDYSDLIEIISPMRHSIVAALLYASISAVITFFVVRAGSLLLLSRIERRKLKSSHT